MAGVDEGGRRDREKQLFDHLTEWLLHSQTDPRAAAFGAFRTVFVFIQQLAQAYQLETGTQLPVNIDDPLFNLGHALHDLDRGIINQLLEVDEEKRRRRSESGETDGRRPPLGQHLLFDRSSVAAAMDIYKQVGSQRKAAAKDVVQKLGNSHVFQGIKNHHDIKKDRESRERAVARWRDAMTNATRYTLETVPYNDPHAPHKDPPDMIAKAAFREYTELVRQKLASGEWDGRAAIEYADNLLDGVMGRPQGNS